MAMRHVSYVNTPINYDIVEELHYMLFFSFFEQLFCIFKCHSIEHHSSNGCYDCTD